MVVCAQPADRPPHVLLPHLGSGQPLGRRVLRALCDLDPQRVIDRPSGLPGGLLLLGRPLGRVGLGLGQSPLGLPRLSGQGAGGAPAQLILDVEQVGPVRHAQAFTGVRRQRLGLVADSLDDGHRESRQSLGQGRRPGGRVAALGVLLHQQEVGGGLDGHQADLRVKRLVLADGDRLRRHGGGQALALLLAEVHEGLLEGGGHFLLRAVGGGHHAVEVAEAQEVTDEADAAGPLLGEDEVGGSDETVDEGQPLRGFEEGSENGIGVEVGLACEPVAERGAWEVVLCGELSLGEPFVVEGGEVNGDIVAAVASRVR